jgi:WD40 repeat protein
MPDAELLGWNWLADGRGIALVKTSEGPYVWEFSDEHAAPPAHRPPSSEERLKKGAMPMFIEDLYRRVAVSPDGKYFAGCHWGDNDKKKSEIVLWHLETQRKLADLKVRRLALSTTNWTHLLFTPDNRSLVAIDAVTDSKSLQAAVFEVAGGTERSRFSAPIQNAQHLRFALSSKSVALASYDDSNTVVLCDLDSGQTRQIAAGHKSDRGAGVGALTFTPDGKSLVTGGRDGSLKIWDVAAAKEVRTITNAYSRNWIEALALSHDGKSIACGGQKGMIRHWDLATGTPLDSPAGYFDRVASIQVTPDGATALTAGWDSQFYLWDLRNGRQKQSYHVPMSAHHSPTVSIVPKGGTFVAVSGDKVKAWDAATGREINLPELPADLKGERASFAGDGKSLFLGGADSVTWLDWPSGKRRRQFTMTKPKLNPGEEVIVAYCHAVELSPDGGQLATLIEHVWQRKEGGRYGDEGAVELWDPKTGKRIHRLIDDCRWGKAMFTPEGNLLFNGGGKLHPRGDAAVPLEGQIYLIDPQSGRLLRSFEKAPVLPSAVNSSSQTMGISPDGRTVFRGGSDGTIHLYETATGKIRRSLARHRGSVMSIAVTADGKRLLTSSWDLTALVWDISLAGFAAKQAGPLTAEEQAKVWGKLLDADAGASYQAMATLAAHPKIAVALVAAGVKRVTKSPDDATLDRLVAELGDDKFAVRERAARELDELGDEVATGIRARLAKAPPLETQRRLTQFLNKHDRPTAKHLRDLRAVEIMEQLNTPASRAVLADLAQGAANSRLTRAAAQSLGRLK